MLSYQMLKGENPNKDFKKSILTHSVSAKSIFSIKDYRKKYFNNDDNNLNKFAKTQRKFSIYTNSKIFKSPLDYDKYKYFKKIRNKEKSIHHSYINSYHTKNIRKKFNETYRNFYLTNLKEKYNDTLNMTNNTTLNFKKKIFKNRSNLSNIIKENKSNFDSFSTSKTQKRNFILGKIMDDFKKPNTLVNYCNKISLMKKIEIENKNRIIELIDNRKKYKKLLDNYYYTLKRNKQIYLHHFDIIYVKYIIYLEEIIDNEKMNLLKLKEKKKQLSMKVSHLKNLIQKENENLDELINIRNFLIKVKEKQLEIPSLLKKILKIGKIEENEIKDKKEFERYKSYLDKSKLFFRDQDEFFYILSDIENKNIKLLIKYQKINNSIEKLKSELEELKESENRINEILSNQMNNKEEIKNEIFNEYNYNYSQKNKLKKLSDNDKEKNNHNNIHNLKSIEDNKYLMNLIKYKNILSQYPIQYSYLFIKLGEGIQFFLKKNILNFENLITIAKNKNELEKFLSINELKEDNFSEITSKCIKLLFFYEISVNKILEKNKNYLKDPILKSKMEIIILKKSYFLRKKNAKEQKILLEKKKIYEIKKVIGRNNKKRFKQFRKVNSLDYFFNKVKSQKSKSIDIKIKKINDSEIDIYNEYLEY